MPSLKQLTCSVEWASTNMPFQEFGTAYGDGVVETFILVPKQPQAFTIHLVSKGFIAEGLSMIVFIDGEYQCNRNRSNLRPSKKGEPSNISNIEFRLRQKEKSIGDGKYLGREWRFDTHNIVYEPVPNETIAHFDQLGNIEVFVLRCKSRHPSDQGKDTSESGADSHALDDSSDDESEEEKGEHSNGASNNDRAMAEEEFPLPFLGGLDGASDFQDHPQYFGLAGDSYMYSMPYAYQPMNPYTEFFPGYIPVRPQQGQPIYPQGLPQQTTPQPPQPTQASEKRVHFNFGPNPEPNLHAQSQSNTSWQHTPSQTTQQPMQPSQMPLPHYHQVPFPASYMRNMVPPHNASMHPSWVPGLGVQPQMLPPLPHVPLGSIPLPYGGMSYQQYPGYYYGPIHNFSQPYFSGGWSRDATGNNNTASGIGQLSSLNNQQESTNMGVSNDRTESAWKADNSFNISESQSNDGDNRNNGNTEDNVNSNNDNGWGNLNDDNPSNNLSNNVDEKQNLEENTNGEQPGGQNSDKQTNHIQNGFQSNGWGQPSQGSTWPDAYNQTCQHQSPIYSGMDGKPQGGFQQPQPNIQLPIQMTNMIPGNQLRSLYGPYGAYIQLKTSAADEALAEVEEEPRYDVPINVAHARLSTHQVVPGRGYKYLHRRSTPNYVDSIDEPYARFVFKYRTREQLQVQLGIQVDAEPSADAEVQAFQAMEKQQMIEMLLRAQRALGGRIPSPPQAPTLVQNDEHSMMQPEPVPAPNAAYVGYKIPMPRNPSHAPMLVFPGFHQFPAPAQDQVHQPFSSWETGATDGRVQSTTTSQQAFGAWTSSGQLQGQQQSTAQIYPSTNQQFNTAPQGPGTPRISSAGSSQIGAHEAPANGTGGGSGWAAEGGNSQSKW